MELRKIDFLSFLQSRDFLRDIYQLVQEHARLESEKPKVAEVAGKARLIVGRYRNAQKRLRRTEQELKEFEEKYGDLIESPLKYHIDSAVDNIRIIEELMAQRAKTWVSKVHSKSRKPKGKPSKWEVLLKGYDYELKSLHLLASDHWLWQVLNRTLDSFVARSGKKLSDMTRFKLISAICQAAGISHVGATTIKEYLLKNP